MKSDYPTMQQLPALRELWKLAFGDDDEFLDSFFSTGFSHRRSLCITEQGLVAAALYWFDCSCGDRKLAYLYAVATHPDFRGQGLCRQLISDTRELLTAQGYDGILLVPENDSLRKMYGRMDFANGTKIRDFVCGSQSGAVDIHPITREDYARLRRISVPADSVLQEGENLLFLETQAKFFAGSGFLLCAVRGENDNLRGIEYLGPTELCPRILCTLGYAHGSFRTPGNQQEFAMWLPLTEGTPVPAYFGLDFS